MTDKDNQKKKNEETDPEVIKAPTYINIDGFIDANSPLFTGTAYKNVSDLIRGNSDIDILGTATLKDNYLGGGIFASPTIDITKHTGLYGGTQPLTFSTQSDMLGASSFLGKNLLEMPINTIGDARNFLVGVNNIASDFSKHNEWLTTVESIENILHTGKLTTDMLEAHSGIDLLNINSDYILAGEEMYKFSESMTTVLAYGQAVNRYGNLFPTSPVINNEITLNRLDNSGFILEKETLINIDSEEITSPYIFTPQEVDTEEITESIPEVKKELPIKTTEAIEMIEYFRNPDTKKGDEKVLTTLNEVKRAIENVVGFSTMVIQQTTIRQVIIGKNNEPLLEDLIVGPLTYRKDGAILYKQTPIKMRAQMKTLCVLFMKNHKNYVDYSTIKDELVSAEKRPTTSFKTITKYVSELHKLLEKHFKREVIFNQEKDGYIFNTD